MTGFNKVMRFCNTLQEYQSAKNQGKITDDLFVVILQEKAAKFKGQTFDWSENADLTALATKGELEAFAEEIASNERVWAEALNDLNDRINKIGTGVDDTLNISSTNPIQNMVVANALSTKADSSSLAMVATSGSYNDLSNKPAIPSEVTESTVSGWGFTKNTGTYSKPSTGIPKTDLASDVQTSLGKADTALQSYTEQYKGTVTGVKMNGTTKNPSNGVVDLGTVITEHQDISGKQDTLVSGINIKTVQGESILGEGNISISVPTVDAAFSTTSTNAIQNKAVANALNEKQDTISDLATIRSNASKGATAVQQVKTINGQSIVGEGNIEITAGTDIDVSTLATKEELATKQDVISDLEAIRSGAAKGETALQSVPSEYVTEAELDAEINGNSKLDVPTTAGTWLHPNNKIAFHIPAGTFNVKFVDDEDVISQSTITLYIYDKNGNALLSDQSIPSYEVSKTISTDAEYVSMYVASTNVTKTGKFRLEFSGDKFRYGVKNEFKDVETILTQACDEIEEQLEVINRKMLGGAKLDVPTTASTGFSPNNKIAFHIPAGTFNVKFVDDEGIISNPDAGITVYVYNKDGNELLNGSVPNYFVSKTIPTDAEYVSMYVAGTRITKTGKFRLEFSGDVFGSGIEKDVTNLKTTVSDMLTDIHELDIEINGNSKLDVPTTASTGFSPNNKIAFHIPAGTFNVKFVDDEGIISQSTITLYIYDKNGNALLSDQSIPSYEVSKTISTDAEYVSMYVASTNVTKTGKFRLEFSGDKFKDGLKVEIDDLINKIDKPSDAYITMPIPQLAKINIVAASLPLSKTDDIRGVLEFDDMQGTVFTKNVILNAQGNSTLGLAKKNFSVDILDENYDKSHELKFGDWVAQDGFHLKSYMLDGIRVKSLAAYDFYEDIVKTRSISKDRAWKRMQLPANIPVASNEISDSHLQIDDGAKNHPSGFPVIVYHNGQFHGIYCWQLKKHRKNYHQEKKNASHIHLDGNISNILLWNANGSINWNKWAGKEVESDSIANTDGIEIRNPKPLILVDGSEYDADANAGELISENSANYDSSNADMVRTATVRRNIENFSRQVYSLSQMTKGSEKKATIAEVFDVDSIIDYIIFGQIMRNNDGYKKNWQWVTYDGVKWAVNAYDLDGVWGWSSWSFYAPSSGWLGYETPPTFMVIENYLDEIKARYAELRKKGIITLEQIMKPLVNYVKVIGIDYFDQEFEKWTDGSRDNLWRFESWMEESIRLTDTLMGYNA